MQKFHIKRGDIVVVIRRRPPGKQGKVLEILADKQRARVEGVAMIKRHLKKSQEHPQGTSPSARAPSTFQPHVARPLGSRARRPRKKLPAKT